MRFMAAESCHRLAICQSLSLSLSLLNRTECNLWWSSPVFTWMPWHFYSSQSHHNSFYVAQHLLYRCRTSTIYSAVCECQIDAFDTCSGTGIYYLRSPRIWKWRNEDDRADEKGQNKCEKTTHTHISAPLYIFMCLIPICMQYGQCHNVCKHTDLWCDRTHVLLPDTSDYSIHIGVRRVRYGSRYYIRSNEDDRTMENCANHGNDEQHVNFTFHFPRLGICHREILLRITYY